MDHGLVLSGYHVCKIDAEDGYSPMRLVARMHFHVRDKIFIMSERMIDEDYDPTEYDPEYMGVGTCWSIRNEEPCMMLWVWASDLKELIESVKIAEFRVAMDSKTDFWQTTLTAYGRISQYGWR
jgi:hypothetical protein